MAKPKNPELTDKPYVPVSYALTSEAYENFEKVYEELVEYAKKKGIHKPKKSMLVSVMMTKLTLNSVKSNFQQ